MKLRIFAAKLKSVYTYFTCPWETSFLIPVKEETVRIIYLLRKKSNYLVVVYYTMLLPYMHP